MPRLSKPPPRWFVATLDAMGEFACELILAQQVHHTLLFRQQRLEETLQVTPAPDTEAEERALLEGWARAGAAGVFRIGEAWTAEGPAGLEALRQDGTIAALPDKGEALIIAGACPTAEALLAYRLTRHAGRIVAAERFEPDIGLLGSFPVHDLPWPARPGR